MLPFIYDLWNSAFEAEKAAGEPGWAHTWSFLNLFQYITFRAACAGLLSFVVSLIAGPYVIRRLISSRWGNPSAMPMRFTNLPNSTVEKSELRRWEGY